MNIYMYMYVITISIFLEKILTVLESSLDHHYHIRRRIIKLGEYVLSFNPNLSPRGLFLSSIRATNLFKFN